MNVDGQGDGTGTVSGVEANQGTQNENENERRGTGPGRVQERQICARKPTRVVDVTLKTRETWAEGIRQNTKNVLQ